MLESQIRKQLLLFLKVTKYICENFVIHDEPLNEDSAADGISLKSEFQLALADWRTKG